MRVQVTFRLNVETGEVEVFQVDDLGGTVTAPDHDAVHDDIAHRIGRTLDPRPDVEEVLPAAPGVPLPPELLTDDSEVAAAARAALEGGEP